MADQMPAADELLVRLHGARVAVTGASGFVGSHVVRELVLLGAQVTVLFPEPEAPRLADVASACDRFALDLCDAARARDAIAATRAEIVLHLAAYGVQRRERDLARAVAVNVAGASAVVEGAAHAGARLVVQVGTSHEYGGAQHPLPEEAPLQPTGIYGATKAAGMLVGRARARELGIRWVGLRPFVTYGPSEDADKLIPYVITRALAGEPALTTAGEQVRDLTFVEDVARAVSLVAAADMPDGEILNIASGLPVLLSDVTRALAALLPGADLRQGARAPAIDDVARQVADVTKQRALLPAWQPTTTLEQGLRRTVDWFQGRRSPAGG